MLASLLPRLAGKYRRLLSVRFGRRTKAMQNAEPLISFTFDDFPKSALATGGKILAENGLSGTYYASLGLAGKLAPTGPIFEAEELTQVSAGGHELGCHTYAHCDASITAPGVFEDSIVRNREVLEQYLPGYKMQSLSYPIGSPTPATKRRSGKHFKGCRGGGQTHNAGKIDLNYLNAFFIEQSLDRPSMISSAIHASCEANGWLIFATHDVSESHTRYGCNPALFEKIVKESAASGARIVLISEGLRLIGVDADAV